MPVPFSRSGGFVGIGVALVHTLLHTFGGEPLPEDPLVHIFLDFVGFNAAGTILLVILAEIRTCLTSGNRMHPTRLSPIIWGSIAVIFWADVQTPAENVSICFAYCIPITLSLLENRGRCFYYAAVATLLSLVGSVFQPPPSTTDLISFATNRTIAVGTQWLVAAVVWYQRQLQDALQWRVAEEQGKVEQQRRLTNILSHEIGSALTTIGGQAYRLVKLSQNLDPGDVVRRAGKIERSVARIKAVVDRIQLATSLESGRIPIEPRPVELHNLLKSVVLQIEEDQQHRIRLELSRLPSCVEVDEALMLQAFENVIQNSLRYSEPEAPLTIRGEHNGDRAQIAVTDQGQGIDPADLPHLKTAYYRGKNSRGTSGTGLGLYLVDQIVSAHGGSLSIRSKVGEGTTVTIEIPVVAEAGGGHQ